MNNWLTNRGWILAHLREAHEELTRTIAEMEADTEYSEVEFEIALAHMYNHMNTAWNSRNIDSHRIAECSDDDFYAWRDFPQDIVMGK
jgi:hypothetical protein